MATATHKSPSDERSQQGEYVDRGTICNEKEADSKTNLNPGAWITIASAYYSIHDFDDFKNCGVKEEFVDIKEEVVGLELEEEFIDLPREEILNEDLHEDDNMPDLQEIPVYGQLNVKGVTAETKVSDESPEKGTEAKRSTKSSTKSYISVLEKEDEYLPLAKKLKILERSEKRRTQNKLVQKYESGPSPIQRIQKDKYAELTYLKNLTGKSEEYNLDQTKIPLSISKRLLVSKKIEILKELEKGELQKELAEKYGVHATTIRDIKRQKGKILTYVQNLKERGEENKLNRTTLPSSKANCLPLFKKVDILKELEKGESHNKLAKKYEVHRSTIGFIQKQKDKILTYVQNSVEKGEADKLNRKMLPKSSSLPFSKKLEILEKLGKGETPIKLGKQYEVSTSTIKRIQEKKDDLLTYVQNPIERSEEDELNVRTLSPSQQVFLPLSKKVEILERLEKGKTPTQLGKKYGVSLETILDIQQRKNKIMTYAQNSIEINRGQQDKLNWKMLPLPQWVAPSIYLTFSQKFKILKELDNGESQCKLAEKYGVSSSTISRIKQGKDKILTYVQNSKGKGEKNKLNKRRLPSSQEDSLPLFKQIEISDALDKDMTITQLEKKQSVDKKEICCIPGEKNKILTHVQNEIEKGEKVQLNVTKEPNSKPVCLTLSKKLKILEELDNGETQIELGKKYGVSKNTIQRVQQRKDKILTYAQTSIEKGEDNWNMKTLPQSRLVFLPLSKKVKIFEEYEKGETKTQLGKKYGVSRSTISYFLKQKDKILTYVQNLIEKGEKDELKKTKALNSKSEFLTLSEELKILKELDKGESLFKLGENYAVSSSTIQCIQQRKDSILTYVQNLIDKEEVKLKRTTPPPSRRWDYLPLSKKLQILELEKDKTKTQLVKKYGVERRAPGYIQEQQDKIPSYPKSSTENVAEDKLSEAKIKRSKLVSLLFSKRENIIEGLRKREPAVQLAVKSDVRRTRSYFTRIAKGRKNEKISDADIEYTDLREDSDLNLRIQRDCVFQVEAEQRDHETTGLSQKAENAEEGDVLSDLLTSSNFTKYSKLEIEDWHNNFVKEEYIDISDDEAIQD